MSRQAQLLTLAGPAQTLAEAKELANLSIGVIHPLEMPYNFFINLNHLMDPDQNLIYFFVTIYGSKKIALWGTYNKRTQEFLFDGGCKYIPWQLSDMIQTWKGQNV